MGKAGRKRRGAPARAFLRPLVMLTVGAVAGIAIWRVLMADPGSLPEEQLTQQDRRHLERLLEERSAD